MDAGNTGGEEFLTAFLQNNEAGYGATFLHLLLTTLSDSLTSVTILSQADGILQKVTVKPRQSAMVNININIELTGSQTSAHVLLVRCDHPISVQAINAKPNSGELTLLRPVSSLGTEYFVFTPPSISSENLKEFAVVACGDGASISVQLKGEVTFEGKLYPPGSVLTLTLEPYEVVQLQSTADLSGSKITANNPVAVFSGHSCAQKHTDCNHVMEQLLPTSTWGTHYVVPVLACQTRFDLVYVVASQTTKLTYRHGDVSGSKTLEEGDVSEFEVRHSQPLYLSADVGIQVLLFGTGATKGRVTYDPYLVLIPDVEAYCPAYVVDSMPNSSIVAIMMAQTKAVDEVTVDGQRLGANVAWIEVPGTEFSYAEMDISMANVVHEFRATTNFGLLIFGLVQSGGYGTAAACLQSE